MLRRWFPAVGALGLLLGSAGTSSAQFFFLPIGFGNPVFGYGTYNTPGGYSYYPGGIGMNYFPGSYGAFSGYGPVRTGVSTYATNPYYNGYNAALGAQASYFGTAGTGGPVYSSGSVPYGLGGPSYVAYAPRFSGVTGVSYTAPEQAARILVRVPAGAELWFDGHKTSQTGTERTFHTPALEKGRQYHYTIRARWMKDGQPVEETERVEVSAGSRANVVFPKAK
jgi:uncharacterized protein (TIGR03000 family)